jgi:hypothetical protein
MKFKELVKLYGEYPLIDSKSFAAYSDRPQHLRRQVRDWVQKGYLLPLKRGLYLFNKDYRKKNVSSLFIANYLLSPSYISLEYALYYYGLIPERVTVLTSITTKKTMSYDNFLARFEYRSVKKDLFFGFKKAQDEEFSVSISLPEKAILDLIYLNSDFEASFGYFDSLRFQNLEILDADRIRAFKKKYPKRVQKTADLFVDYIENYKRKYRELQ